MERIKKYLMILFLVLSTGVCLNVYAEDTNTLEFDYYLSNSAQNYEYVGKNSSKTTTVERGDIISVTAVINNKLNVTKAINNGKLTIRWDEKYVSLQQVGDKYYDDSISNIPGLTIGSANKSDGKLTLTGISSSANGLSNGKSKVVELKFQVLNDTDASSFKVYQMDGEDTLECVGTGETQVPQESTKCGESLYSELKYSIKKSTVCKLSSIKINGQEIENFNENTNEYNINVDSNTTKVSIEAVKKDSRSTISGDTGEKQIDYGTNRFHITVTSEASTKNSYVINVNRTDTRSNVNTLKTLTLSEGEITFDPSITEYTVNVLNEVEKVTITSSLTDSKSKYVVDFQNKEVELTEGSNKIEIKVVSEKGEEKTYTLNINRALSSNNSLKSLKINDEKIKLGENEFIYNITVENDVDEVVIEAIPTDSRATVKLDEKYPLEVGDNEIIITITAASGQEASYTINVTRKKILSKDSLLVNLKIKGYEIDFKQDVKLYNLKIDDGDDELEITAIPEDASAVIDIEGNKNLENGSIIKINVKAEDGTFTRYFINIEKGSTGISPIIIVIIILTLLLVGCIGLIIYRKKRKEKKIFKNLDKDDKNDEVKEEVKNTVANNEVEPTSNSEMEENEETKEDGQDSVTNHEVETTDNIELGETPEENYVGAHEENEVEIKKDEEKDA